MLSLAVSPDGDPLAHIMVSALRSVSDEAGHRWIPEAQILRLPGWERRNYRNEGVSFRKVSSARNSNIARCASQ
jgi:hypothetical protein